MIGVAALAFSLGVAFTFAAGAAGGGGGPGGGPPSGLLLLGAGAKSSGPVGPAALSKAGNKLRQFIPVKPRNLRPGPGGAGPSGGGILEETKPSGVLNVVVSSPSGLGAAETQGLMGYHVG